VKEGYMKKFAIALITGSMIVSFVYADSLRVIANPPSRTYACMITDSINNRTILFGGGIPWVVFFNDLWSLDLNTEDWTLLHPSGIKPAPRFMASAVYYPDSNAMILIGGRISSYYFDEVWLLKLTPGAENWRQVTVGGTHPSPARSSAACVWDRLNNRLIYCGGEANSVYYNDVWQLNLDNWTWSQIFPAGAPPSGRYGHSAVYDSVNQRMILFGGENGTYHNDLWALSLNTGGETWTLLNPSGNIPVPRSRQFTAFDPVNNTMVIGYGYTFDGSSFTFYNDAWVLGLNPLQWYRVLTNGPIGRRGMCAAYNPLNRQTIIFGGDGYRTLFGDTYSLLSDTSMIAVDEINPIKPVRHQVLQILGTPAQLPCRFIVTIPLGSIAVVAIYDKIGRLIRSIADNVGESASRQVLEWDGKDDTGRAVPAGTYFIKLETGTASCTEKIVIVR